MAPYFELVWKIEIMRMISFPGGSQVERDWNSRIEDCCAGWLGDEPCPEIEDVKISGIQDCEPMRMASLLFEDYIQTDLRRMKFGWRKTKPSQKEGVQLNLCVVLRLTRVF